MANEQAQQLRILMTTIKVATALLHQRVYTLLSLAAAIGLWSWVMYQPDWIRFGAACAYSLYSKWCIFDFETKQLDAQGAQS